MTEKNKNKTTTGKTPSTNNNRKKPESRKVYVTNARDARKDRTGKTGTGRSTRPASPDQGSGRSGRTAPSGRGSGKSPAASSGKGTGRNTASPSGRGSGRSASSARSSRTSSRTGNNSRIREEELKMTLDRDDNLRDEIGLIVTALACVLMILSYLKLCGSFGNIINKVVFGLFGSFGYVFPFMLFTIVLFAISNKRNVSIISKVIYCFLIMVVIAAFVQLTVGGYDKELGITDYFNNSLIGYDGPGRTYGGLLGGLLIRLLCPFLGNIGTGAVLIAGLLILLILILGRTVFTAITRRSAMKIGEVRQRHKEEKEEARIRREEMEEYERARHEQAMSDRDEYDDGYDDEYGDDNDIQGEQTDFDEIGHLEDIIFKNGNKANPAGGKAQKENFIDKLMRKGMGLDMDRLSQTPEYRELRDNYGVTDYEMGEVSPSENAEENTAPDENEDFVSRELDRKFGDNGSGQVVHLSEHTRKPKEKQQMYLVDEDPDNPEEEFDNIPDQVFWNDDEEKEQLTNDLKVQVGALLENGSGDVGAAGNGDENAEPEGETADDEHTGRSNVRKLHSSDDTDDSKTSDISDHDGSGAVRFNTPEQVKEVMEKAEKAKANPPYVFPPISLLKKGEKSKNVNQSELDDTVKKLQSTFESFGVKVRVTDATCGPTVTRYELYPEQGVKVKTITSLTDDIKLSLAAQDIRIEAPIPGKAAVGIEVPNKTTTPVFLRDLIDSPEFKDSKSNLTFAVGKDIGGKTICSDIAGMPHMLVAGSTGSGKSVCINSLILSIIYKSKPSDVRMIMFDPKRVELTRYNGIPHLLVPVITDVKKASGALNWAVAEMDDRYDRFANVGVNNLASYNRLMEEKYYEEGNEGECPDRLPQILIIIDELNDLMMTANSKEVEAAIVRLTQLARACGIHLVLATQRPSVNVITGTIKANIPTRIAFSVSSIVDSRTILDQAGAERLLGKGDMLFFPQGYPQPVRLQGAYVSDSEIAAVVDFIKSKCKEAMYSETVSKHIENNAAKDSRNVSSSDGQSSSGSEPDDGRDEYFEDAGKLIIQSKKASIGAIQRKYRVGFNRAARIMDQLAENGVVGPEEGTKPRRILMTMEQFEAFIAGGDAGGAEASNLNNEND